MKKNGFTIKSRKERSGSTSSHILGFPVLLVIIIFYIGSCGKNGPVEPVDESPELSVNPSSFEVSAEAGSVNLTIENTGDPTLEWEVSSEANWISFNASSGSGNETVEITYEQNVDNSGRSTEIQISSNGGDESLPFNQAAAPDEESLPTEGLIAYYPFNNNANDESGNGNDGTVNGATLTTDRFGNENSAYSFDGVDNFINIGNGVKPSFPVTVSIWVNLNAIDHMGVFRNDQVDDGSYRYGLEVIFGPDDGKLAAHYYEGFSAPWNRISRISTDPVAEIGVWQHLVAVFTNHNNVTLYLDGEEIPVNDLGSGSGMSYSNADGAIGHKRTNITTPRDRFLMVFLMIFECIIKLFQKMI